MPWTVIEWAIRLIVLLIEGIPPKQRTATAYIWFYMWWPIGKLWMDGDQIKKVDSIMAEIDKDPPKLIKDPPPKPHEEPK